MSRLAKPIFAVGLAVCLCSAAQALDINEDPKPQDYFFARPMGLPQQYREKVFPAGVKRGNFTGSDGIESVTVRNGRLSFTLAGPKATLGWGNYLGRQPVAEIEDMWSQLLVVQLRVRQSAAQSKWTVGLWRDGGRVMWPTAQAELKGQQWQELGFKRLDNYSVSPDGLEFTIEGEKGARIEIEWLKLVQPYFEGYFRCEFTVPEGKVWRAVADVGGANDSCWWHEGYQVSSRLHVNGKVVERQSPLLEFHTSPVDIAPFLKPGRNCVGFYGYGIFRPPVLYFQSRIIMESGEVVAVTSGDHWKYSAKAAEGWSQPSFDDSSWARANPKDSVLQGLNPIQPDYASRPNIPAYSGSLVMKNPHRRDLFYLDTSEVVVDVHVPSGLKGKQPATGFLFGRADLDGAIALVKEGRESSFTEQGGSLVYRLNLGQREHGVYVLALSLKSADGTLIEERHREPLVVLRKVPQKQIAGTDYLEGLEVELEDTVDFTNPKDPHPWIECKRPADHQRLAMEGQLSESVKEPIIARKDGLIYREVAGDTMNSAFSYRIEFKHPGSFYCLELEYPDDAKRTIQVGVASKIERIFLNIQSGVGAETGGRFLPTGTMQTLRWIHVAEPGPHSVDVMNVFDGEKAAAKSLKIFRVKGDLPSVGAGANRLYGIHSERCHYASGIGLNFGVRRGELRDVAQLQEFATVPPARIVLRDLTWMEQSGERYVQYLRFAGQNCHVMGCFMYFEKNSPFVPSPDYADSRVLHCMKTMMANLFEANGIDFYAGIAPCNFDALRSFANNAQVAKGADTLWMVNARGQQRYTFSFGYILAPSNWLHPQNRAAHRGLIRDLANTYGHLSRFRGVHGMLGLQTWVAPAFGSSPWPPSSPAGQPADPPAFSYDDLTFQLFEKESGFRLSVSGMDPDRFAKRAALLRHPALRDRFDAWRCDKLRDFCAEAAQTLRGKRQDLQMVNLTMGPEDMDISSSLVKSGKPFEMAMRELGVDVGLLNTVDNLWAGRWALAWYPRLLRSGRSAQQDPYWWRVNTSPRILSAFEHESKRYVFVHAASFLEQYFQTGGQAVKNSNDHSRLVESDWIMNGYKEEGLPQPAGYHCREPFTQAIIASDPRLIFGAITDMNINQGHEQMLRSILKTYTCLPQEKFKPVLNTGLETNLAIRQLSKGNESYFYVANPCQWHVSGAIALETDGKVTELVSGTPVALTDAAGTRQLAVKLTPFDLTAYRVSSPKLSITAYRTDPMEAEELARLQGVINRIAQLLNDPVSKLALAPADRKPVAIGIQKAQEAVKAGKYAFAWRLLTDYRVWGPWQDFLEKAATQGKTSEASGRIEYDAAGNRIQLVGFPEDAPATLDTILAADRKNGWGKVRYDQAADTYTVDSDVWIGDDQSNGTFLRIGDKEHPQAIVVVKGSVWVRPCKESPRRSDGRASVNNSLILGDPDDKTIRATLKIACQKPAEHGVFVGYCSSDGKVRHERGELHVFNSTITAATPDRQHAWGRWNAPPYEQTGWHGSDVHLINATVSWFTGCVTPGADTGEVGPTGAGDVTAIRLSKRFIIEGTTFEHGGVAVQNRDHYLRNCVFRDLDEAVAEGGCLGARLVNCTFEGNRANWSLGSLSSRGIVLTDCTLGPQKEPVRVAKNSAPLSFLTPRSLSVYPACSECASLIVKVLDAAGKPVPNAVVLVSCEDDPQEITRGATFTDDRGLTPSDAETDAIVITTRKYRATEDPNRPQQATFGYKVSVAKAGFRPKTLKLPAGRPIRRPLVVRLESQTATASPAQAARTWTDSTGKYRIQATLLDFDGKVVRLKRPDGKTIALPLEKLSESDREYIRSQANE